MAAAKGANEKDQRPIIVRRVKKVVGHGHHGGAWKVAYADFVTAMMAFFLVMWLVGALTTKQREAVSDYFKNPSPIAGASPAPAPGMNGPGGASNSMIKLGGSMELPRAPGTEFAQKPPGEMTAEERRAQEKQRLEALMQELQEAIGKSQALEPFKDQLLLDITPEGLRIQIVDEQNRPMFDTSSAELKPYSKVILREIGRALNAVPNKVSFSGHTDAAQFVGGEKGFSNWELSANRANASRREMIAGGMDENKVLRVVGLSSTVLFDKNDPLSSSNRRINIVVLNKRTEEAMLQEDGNATVDVGADTETEAATAASSVGSPPAGEM